MSNYTSICHDCVHKANCSSEDCVSCDKFKRKSFDGEKRCNTDCLWFNCDPKYLQNHCTHKFADDQWEVVQPFRECKMLTKNVIVYEKGAD